MEITFSSEIKNNHFIRHAFIGNEDYYFKVDKKYQNEITCLDDPFCVLLIFRMMREGGTVKIKGRVSKSLLASLEFYAAYWRVIVPKLYKKIDIQVQEEFDDAPVSLENKAIACFSGGLDAAYLLYSHKNNLPGRNSKNIERCVFVWGADVPLTSHEQLEQVFGGPKAMCDDLGIDLSLVETNYRDYPHVWHYELFAVMAAALRLWKNYPYQLIGSSFNVRDYIYDYPYSSKSVTDNILKSNRYKVIVGDCNVTRTQKAAAVKQWPAALKNLRVCSNMFEQVYNCGICEKCTRTYLNFIVAGADNLPCIKKPFNLRNAMPLSPGKLLFYTEILDYMETNNLIGDPIYKQLCSMVSSYKRTVKLKSLIAPFSLFRYKLLARICSGVKKEHYKNKISLLSCGRDPVTLLDTLPSALKRGEKARLLKKNRG